MDTNGSYICECAQGYYNNSGVCEGTSLIAYYNMCCEKVNYIQMLMSAYISYCITVPTSVSIQMDLTVVFVNSGIHLRLMERPVWVSCPNFTQYYISGSP